MEAISDQSISNGGITNADIHADLKRCSLDVRLGSFVTSWVSR